MKSTKSAFLQSLFFCLLLFILVGCIGNTPQHPDPVVMANSQPDTISAPADTVDSPKVSPRIVGYFTSWSAYARNVTVSDLDPMLLTHINFAFANLTPEGEIVVGDSWVDTEKGFADQPDGGHFAQLALMKQQNPELKILISVGGWTWSNHFSAVAANPETRKKFAASAVQFLTAYGFDGLDIDWEFPVEGGNGIPHLPQDKENYTLLVAETRKALDLQEQKDGKHYLLTIACGPNPTFVQNTELAKMADDLDFVNIMAYDYHGAWEQKTGHNAPLYDTSGGLCVSNTVEQILSSGIPPEKCNLGLAFYGRGWTGVQTDTATGSLPSGTGFGAGTWEAGVFDYWDLAENYVNQNGYTRYFDQAAHVPYLYNGSVWISYDDPESIAAKISYAKEKGLGGFMYWEFSGDKKKSLQRTLADHILLQKATSPSIQNTTKPSTAPKAPSADGSSSSVPAWSASSIYEAGDLAEYHGTIYQAKWWTQNEPPEPVTEWGPWKQSDN